MASQFRLSRQTLAISAATQHTVMIPVGAIIQIPAPAPKGKPMVDVLWNGETVMMFAEDLKAQSPTAARVLKDGLEALIPESVIEVPVAGPDGNPTDDVIWNSETAMTFVEDLKARSKKA